MSSTEANTLIIIPAYNEGRSIKRVVSSIKDLHPHTTIAVIDDGSKDQTAEIAAQAGAVVLSHPFNLGYGISLQTGYKYALENGYERVVQIDGDGQHDPKGIKTLLDTLDSGAYDIVFGSRFLGEGNYKPTLPRTIGIFFFKNVLRLLSRQKVTDPTTGFQAINKNVLRVFVRDIFPHDYPDADVIILLSRMRFKIKEVPVVVYPNTEGKSMHRSPLNALYYIFKMLLSMFVTILRKEEIT